MEKARRRTTIPFVVFEFDDGYEDWYNNCFAALSTIWSQSTCGMITQWFGETYIGLPMLSVAELKSLEDNGWEVGSHSRTHNDMSTMTSGEQASNMEGSITDLESIGCNPTQFIYPFTKHNASSEANTRIYFASTSNGSPSSSKFKIG
jgi:peptidoglycan/xylan/chitin deacetylase (PgdA/CDA1 family)